MTRRIAAIGTLLCVLLGVPRASEAGILDFIWEMSGPQMLGLSHGCLYAPKEKVKKWQDKWVQCRWGEIPTVTSTKTEIESRGPFIGASAGLYTSTGVDSSTQQYDWLEIWMLELAGGLSFRSYRGGAAKNDVEIHHGFGVAYERFFGARTENPAGHIDAFNKFAITLTPFDVTVKKIAFGVKMRFYPEGFTDDQFKKGLPKATDRPFETTLALTFSVVHRN